MSLIWGENIFSSLYPVIKDLYREKDVVKKPSGNVIELQRSVGYEVEKKLQERFVPSFFTQNLCEKTSLRGRIYAKFFSICETLRLHKVFSCFNQKSKLFSVVLKAEQCWLSYLLDTYEDVKSKPEKGEKIKFIAQHLASVVTTKGETLSNEEIQKRLNQSVALTNIFYVINKKGHNYVTNRVPQTYFRFIFGKPEKDNASNTFENPSGAKEKGAESVEQSESVKKLYAELKKCKIDYDKKEICLKIAREEIAQNNKRGATLALDEMTKIHEAGNEKYVDSYCDVAMMRIKLDPDTVPVELKRAAELDEKQRNYYKERISLLPPFYYSNHIMRIAECYLLLNDEEKVSQQIKAMIEFADNYQTHHFDSYLGLYKNLAKFHIESKKFFDASRIVKEIVLPGINDECSSIEMIPAIEQCVELAKAFIENGHVDEPVRSLINAAEKRFERWKEKAGFDVDPLRSLIADVNKLLKDKTNPQVTVA